MSTNAQMLFQIRRFEMYKFIVFEGLNGAGKSTLALALSKKLGAAYVITPPRELSAIRAAVDNNFSVQAHAMFYMLGNIIVSEEIKKIRRQKVVICDRYIHSTIARHRMLGLDLGGLVDLLEFEKPDINFFIFNSNELERRRRISQRGKNNKWDKLDENDDLRRQYMNYFVSNGSFDFIDTSGETIEDSLKKILTVVDAK